MPIGLGTAAAITAGVGAAGAIGSAVIGSNAAKDAAKAQARAGQQAIDTRKEMFEKAKGYLQPYASLGESTLPTIKGLLGLDPNMDMTATLESTPGYKFAVGEGLKQIGNMEQYAGARNSGNALRAASDYTRNMGYGVFSDMFNKYAGIMTTGLNAAGGIANASMETGKGVADTQTGIGNARAAGIMGTANAWQSGISGVTNAVGGLMGGLSGGGGFGFGGGSGGGSWGGTAQSIIDNA